MTTSPLANPTATRELLEEFGLATKHRLGQNFLIDNHVIERICELAELAGDERVLEVGPGCGTLTLALLQEAACVTSIEADPELEPVLDAHAADYANFRFIMGDAVKVGPEQIEQAAGGEPTVFVANLPRAKPSTRNPPYRTKHPGISSIRLQKNFHPEISSG